MEGGAWGGASVSGSAAVTVCVRYRAWLARPDVTVREALLVGTPRGDALTWPTEVPVRYTGRTTPMFTTVVGGVTVSVLRVESALHTVPMLRMRRDVIDLGVWVVDDDWTPRGALPAHGVAARAVVCGLPLAPSAAAVWHAVSPRLPRGDVAPLAVYHGTASSAMPAIQRDGLAPSHGMLGTAVSVGTWWKATRYASRDAHYTLRRPGAAVVVRAYLEPGATRDFDGSGDGCPCDKCVAVRARTAAYAAANGLPPTYDRERTAVADHAGAWMAAYDTAHVGVVPCADSDKYANKNEEWAVAKPRERLELQFMTLLDMATVATPHWDPHQRTQTIC